MAFFQDIKKKLENTLTDLTTIEHALIIEDSGDYIYCFQQIAGDSLAHVGGDPIDEEYFVLFNDAYSAASESRTSLSRFIIECLT